MPQQRATMDFFRCQESARHKTALLVFLFLCTVVFIIWCVYLAVFISIACWQHIEYLRIYVEGRETWEPWLFWWHPWLFYRVAAGVIIVVLIGSLSKIIDLSKGGKRVAEILGGAPVDPNTTNLEQRKLLNVVEEIAIASGIPIPQAYILKNERSINAFAAGLTTDDAIVAVTQGCLDTLSRDELQGVIGHEFSHILNGDMRLNQRLMGIINGILSIAIIGRVLLRARKGGRGAIPIILLGLILVLVGYIGVFFGKLIKSAVSRQREFLADAAAIQFTRNPLGIVGALKKIARGTKGSRIWNPRAEEASHFFFCNGLPKSFVRLLSTHPPIEERIKRIQIDYHDLQGTAVPEPTLAEQRAIDQGILSFMSEPTIQTRPGTVQLQPQQFHSLIGTMQAAHLDYARTLVAGLPPLMSEAAREPLRAMALIYCLLFNKEGTIRRKQLEKLDLQADSTLAKEIKTLFPVMTSLDKEYRLPLLDLAMPALKKMSLSQYLTFREKVQYLIAADDKVNLFEYMVHTMLTNRLDICFKTVKPKKVRYYLFDQVEVECFELISILAWQGSKDASAAQMTFQRGMQIFDDKTTFTILAKRKCNLQLLAQALNRLSESALNLKKDILVACLVCMSADNVITINETELLRAIANTLDCPVPPLIPGIIPA